MTGVQRDRLPRHQCSRRRRHDTRRHDQEPESLETARDAMHVARALCRCQPPLLRPRRPHGRYVSLLRSQFLQLDEAVSSLGPNCRRVDAELRGIGARRRF